MNKKRFKGLAVLSAGALAAFCGIAAIASSNNITYASTLSNEIAQVEKLNAMQSVSLASSNTEVTATTSTFSQFEAALSALEVNDSVNFKGIRYFRSADTSFTAMVSSDAATEEEVWFMGKPTINGSIVTIAYTNLDPTQYTSLKRVYFVGAKMTSAKAFLQGITNSFDIYTGVGMYQVTIGTNCKNLYICDAYDTQSLTYSAQYFPSTNIENVYFADWTSKWILPADISAMSFKNSSDTAINFQSISESDLGHSITEFYPFSDFKPSGEHAGLTYDYCRTTSASATPSLYSMRYHVSNVDSRVKIASTYGGSYIFDGDTVGGPETLIVGDEALISVYRTKSTATTSYVFRTASTSFDFSKYPNAKELWFAPNTTPSDLATLSNADSTNVEKIYIPNEYKSAYDLITTNENLTDKITYYDMSEASFNSGIELDGTVYPILNMGTYSIDEYASALTTYGKYEWSNSKYLDDQLTEVLAAGDTYKGEKETTSDSTGDTDSGTTTETTNITKETANAKYTTPSKGVYSAATDYEVKEIYKIYSPSNLNGVFFASAMKDYLVTLNGEAVSCSISYGTNNRDNTEDYDFTMIIKLKDGVTYRKTVNVEITDAKGPAGYVVFEDGDIVSIVPIADDSSTDTIKDSLNYVIKNKLGCTEEATLETKQFTSTTTYKLGTYANGEVYAEYSGIALLNFSSESKPVDESYKYGEHDLTEVIYYSDDLSLEDAVKIATNDMVISDGTRLTTDYTIEYALGSNNSLYLKYVYGPGETDFVSHGVTVHKIESSTIGSFVYAKAYNYNISNLYMESTTDHTQQEVMDYIMKTVLSNWSYTMNETVDLTKTGETTLTGIYNNNANYYNFNTLVTVDSFDNLVKSAHVGASSGTTGDTKTDTTDPEKKDDSSETKTDDETSIGDKIKETTESWTAKFKEKFESSKVFKYSMIAIGSVLGILLLYGVYLLIRKFARWLKR